MKLLVKKGKTSKMIEVFIQNSSVATGAGLTGLVFNSASLTWYYWRNGAGSASSVTLATMTLGTWASGGFKEMDATNMPGWYQLGIPDAALASGADGVVMMLKGATNMAPVNLEIQLVDFDPQDATSLGLSRLDAAISSRMATFTLPTNFSLLLIDGSGRTDVSKIEGTDATDQIRDSILNDATRFAGANVASIKTQTDKFVFTVANQVDSNVLDWKSAVAPAMTGDAFARLGAPVGASISADIAGVQADTDNIQTRIPAALVGGRMDSSIGAVVNGVITAASFAANALDAVWSTATRLLTAGTNIVLAKGVGVTGFNDLDAAGVRAAVGLASANLDTQLSSLASGETTINNNVIAVGNAVAVLPTAVQNADALLDRNMATGADSGGRTVRNALRLNRNKVAVAAGVMTVYKEDDATSAWTAALTTDAAALPITVVDP